MRGEHQLTNLFVRYRRTPDCGSEHLAVHNHSWRCTSSYTHLPTRAATPQLNHRNCSVGQVLHAAHGQPPHPPPYCEVGLGRSQHQQPQVRWALKPSKEVIPGFIDGPPNRGRESHPALSKGENGSTAKVGGEGKEAQQLKWQELIHSRLVFEVLVLLWKTYIPNMVN